MSCAYPPPPSLLFLFFIFILKLEYIGKILLTDNYSVPAVFMFILQASGSLEFSRTISLPGNPMDIAIVSSEKAVVAVDPGHESASGGDLKKSLLKVEHINGEYKASDDLVQDISDLGDGETDVSEEELQKLLYSAETLRKMESEDGADAE